MIVLRYQESHPRQTTVCAACPLQACHVLRRAMAHQSPFVSAFHELFIIHGVVGKERGTNGRTDERWKHS